MYISNLHISDGSTVMMNGDKVIINGVEYPKPGSKRCSNSTIINGKVYINGYELKNGKWKKTLRAIYHKYF